VLSSYTTYPIASKLLVDLEKGLKLLKNHIKEHRDVFVAKLNKKEKVSSDDKKCTESSSNSRR
jgi:hypothetical protein